MSVLSKIAKRVKKHLKKKSKPDYFWGIREKAKNSKFRIIKYFYTYKYLKLMEKFCCDIPLITKIEGKPSFPHGLHGIFISKGAIIGKDCVIFQQVTIGSNALKDSKGFGAPVLGDNIYIGTGAKIIGNIRIGTNVRIGANAVVVKNIEDDCTVVMNPPRVIKHNEKKDNTWLSYEKIKNDILHGEYK